MAGKRTRRAAVGAFVVCTTSAAVAIAAAHHPHAARRHPPPGGGSPSRNYRGHTSQHQTISFTISGGSVTKLQYSIIDKCTGASNVKDHDSSFPPMRIRASKFGGTFVDRRHAATAVVKGTVSGQRVSGSLSDSVRFRGHACHGSATFSLT